MMGGRPELIRGQRFFLSGAFRAWPIPACQDRPHVFESAGVLVLFSTPN